MEAVLRQDCSETDLRTDRPHIPKSKKISKYERKDETTLIAYCDHKNCNTKSFMQRRLQFIPEDKWKYQKSQGTYIFFFYFLDARH